jgi:hypothetical protein
MGQDQSFECLHWGTLFEATKRAWLADTKKENKAVQLTMATEVKGAKLYKRELPKDCARFLVEYGNLVNNEATGTTFLQVLKSTQVVEPAWTRAKQAMQWTASSIGQGKLNDKKFEFASSMFPMRWQTYTSYERCANFLKDCRGT